MAANPPASVPPPKPWEKAGGTSGPAPFKPPSPGSTSDVVEASGTARPGEIVPTNTTSTVNVNTVGRPMPPRPWEQGYGTTGYGASSYGGLNSGYGGYGSTIGGGYGSTIGTGGMYGAGGMYGGGGMYGSSMYNRGGLGGGLYGSSGMYGGGMYGGGLGGPMGGYGMGGGMGGPYGSQDPNNPYGQPSQPPGFWMSFLRVMEGVVNFFGRISILVDQNTQAVHMFMSALLQLFDRSGMLYGELARFVLRLLGIRTKPRKVEQPHGPPGTLQLPGPEYANVNQQHSTEQPKAAPVGGWDNVWGNDSS
ncbi:hypothetical protein QQ045_017323 [Rhodiola kirilowii]